jgi:hypothetical protein
MQIADCKMWDWDRSSEVNELRFENDFGWSRAFGPYKTGLKGERHEPVL